MKKLLVSFLLLGLSLPTFACEDEQCLRDRASVTNNIEIPGYLTWQFCEDTKNTFMTADVRSLENYRTKRLNIEHRNRMRNIKSFVEKRKEWLAECDNYFTMTNHGRIFRDEETTEEIFAAMDTVASELDAVLRGVTYVNEDGEIDNSVVANKFDSFFKLVEDHKTVMMLKGQFN